MAIVEGNTTATGYGQAYVPMAPPPPPPPIPTYGGLVDDSTAYNASVLGTVPPVAGGGPVITVPDAPAYRDPNNPNVVWNEEYQRWYDTASGLWRNPDTGTWENWAGTQTWNPNTGKQIPTAAANIVNQASLQPTAEGMAAAKAIIQGGGGAKTIVATPDRPKTLADWAAEFPDAPGVKLAEDVAGMWQGPGIPERTGPLSLAGLESYPASEIERLVNLGNPQDGPGFTSSSGVQYPVEYLRDSQGRPLYEQNIMGEWVPVQKATLSGLDILRETASAQTASPYQLEEFDPIRSRLPGFVNESIEFATSPVGAASNILFPFTGASSVGANIGLNIAQDLAFGAAKVGAEKAGVPEPLAYALGFAAAVGSEAAMGRALGKIAGNAADMPAVLPRRTPDVPKIDMFTGRDVRLTLSDGSAIPAVDMGAGALPGYRAIQLPDGQIVDAQTDVLEHLAPRKPLTIGDQIDDVLNPNAVTDPRAAMRYPAEEITAPDFRRGSVENDVTVKRSKGTSTLTDQVTGEEVGRVVNEPGTGYRATLADGTDVGTYKSTVTAENAIKGAYVARKGTETPLEGAVDLARGTRAVKVAGKPINQNIADSMAAAVIDPSPETVERASQMAMSEVTNVDFVGVNLADIAYVLGKDAEGNPINVSKLVEYRKIDEMARNGVINPRKDPLYRVPKDLLNEEYKIQTGGQWVQNAKGEWKVAGGRRPTWLVPKGSRPLVYDTRELHQAAMREAGFDNEMIRAILPEGPGLRTADGGYLHGSLLSYMNARDWRKTLDLEKAALQAPDSNTLIRLKLEQAKIAGVDFNPFDPRTSYGLFKFIDDPQVRKAAEAAVKNVEPDMATPGSASNLRARAVQLGTAEAVDIPIHTAEVEKAGKELVAASPPAVIPTRHNLLSLVEKSDETVKRSRLGRAVNRAGGAVDIAMTPAYAMRNFKFAGDSMQGRQLRRMAVNHPIEGAKAYRTFANALRSKSWRDEGWEYVAKEAKDRPHLDLFVRGERASLEQEMYMGNLASKILEKTPLGVVEDANALTLNMVRLSLDDKMTAMALRPSTFWGKVLPWKDGGGKTLSFTTKTVNGVGYRIPADKITADYMAAQGRRISILTGRGTADILDKNPGLVKALNSTAFVSARFTLSTFQFWGQLIPATASFAAKTGFGQSDAFLLRQAWTRTILASSVAATAYTLLSQVPGIETVEDATSSKFGQFKWRGNWYDFLGGLEDPVRLFTIMEKGYSTSASGYQYKYRENGSFDQRMTGALKAGFAYIEGRMPPVAREIAARAGYVDRFPDKQSIPYLPDWTSRWTPLSLSQVFDIWRDVNGPGDGFWAALDTLAVFGGEGVTGPTEAQQWEKNVVADRKMAAALDDDAFWMVGEDGRPLPRNDYGNLSSAGRAYVANHPETFGTRPSTSSGEFRRNNELAASHKTSTRVLVEQLDRDLRSGKIDPGDYRKQEAAYSRSLSAHLRDIYGEYDEKTSTDGVEVYYDIVDRYTYRDEDGNEIIDWQAIDEAAATEMSPLQKKQLKRYREEMSARGTDIQQDLDKAKDRIDESGYFDLKEQFYQTWVRDHPEIGEKYATYTEWRDAMKAAGTEASKALTGGSFQVDNDAGWDAVTKAGKDSGFTDAYKQTVLYPWILENPDAARVAADWGYYTPDATTREFLFGDEASVEAAKEGFKLKKQAEPALDAVTSTAYQAWAASAPALSDGRPAASFKSVGAYIDALRADLQKQAEAAGKALTDDELASIDTRIAAVTDPYTQRTGGYGVSVAYTNKNGTKTSSRISLERKAEYDSWIALYKNNPAAFQVMVSSKAIQDPSTVGRAYLAAAGVVVEWPEGEE